MKIQSAVILILALAAGSASATSFAVIGDFGYAGPNEQAVAAMIDSWQVDFILTVGDNSYNPSAIDSNIGQYYSNYIGAYKGSFGTGSPVNRFFPALGNHDYSDGGGINSYLGYFTLPGTGIASDRTSRNERYYDFIIGPCHFFALNSDSEEPDGIDSSSVQAQWLKSELKYSGSPWNVVLFHHAPYSSGAVHGNTAIMQWPFEKWGVDVVLAGHEHTYERIMRDDNHNGDSIPYIVNGLGGRSIYNFSTNIVPGSAVRYNGNYGAMKVSADDSTLKLQFFSIDNGGTIFDSISLHVTRCCRGYVGNVSMTGTVDLLDLSILVQYMIGGFDVFPCKTEADLSGDGRIDLLDLSAMISYLTGRPGFRLPGCPHGH